MSAHKVIFDEPDRTTAHALAAALQDLFDPGPSALTLFEHLPAGGAAQYWRIEAYYDDAPDTAALTFQMAPSAYQPRREMFELCELHLQLALMTARALREDI